MKWVSATPTSVVDQYLSPPNWQEWMKSLDIEWNWSLSSIIFLNNLPNVLSSTIGWKDLVELYDDLFGLGMITIVDILKWEGQWPRSIQVLAISMSLEEHSLFLMIILMYLYDNLSSLGADELLHFSMVCLSFSLENGYQGCFALVDISSNRLVLTCQLWVELNDLCKVFHKLSSSMQGWLLKWIASIAGSFLFLT